MQESPEMKTWGAPAEPEARIWGWVAVGTLLGAFIAEWLCGTPNGNLEGAAGFLATVGVVTLMGKLYHSTHLE